MSMHMCSLQNYLQYFIYENNTSDQKPMRATNNNKKAWFIYTMDNCLTMKMVEILHCIST